MEMQSVARKEDLGSTNLLINRSSDKIQMVDQVSESERHEVNLDALETL